MLVYNLLCHTFVVGIKVLSLGSITLYTVFMMLGGMIVPLFCGIVLFDEPYTVWKFVAVALMTLALFFNVDDAKIKGGKKNVVKFFFYSFLVFFANGGTDFLQQFIKNHNTRIWLFRLINLLTTILFVI